MIPHVTISIKMFNSQSHEPHYKCLKTHLTSVGGRGRIDHFPHHRESYWAVLTKPECGCRACAGDDAHSRVQGCGEPTAVLSRPGHEDPSGPQGPRSRGLSCVPPAKWMSCWPAAVMAVKLLTHYMTLQCCLLEPPFLHLQNNSLPSSLTALLPESSK